LIKYMIKKHRTNSTVKNTLIYSVVSEKNDIGHETHPLLY